MSFSAWVKTTCRLAWEHSRSACESKRRVVGVARTVVRVLDQTTCRSYVSDDLSFGEGGNDVSFQLPDDRSFGATELVFLTNQNDVVWAGQNDAVLTCVHQHQQLYFPSSSSAFFISPPTTSLSLLLSLSFDHLSGLSLFLVDRRTRRR